jgi:hypothetical protein
MAGKVNLAAYLRDLDSEQLKAYVPEPLIVRVDELVRIVRRSTLPKARHLGDLEGSELVAALILAAPTTDKSLTRIVERYRNARVWLAFPDEKRRSGSRKLPTRRPGRKKR